MSWEKKHFVSFGLFEVQIPGYFFWKGRISHLFFGRITCHLSWVVVCLRCKLLAFSIWGFFTDSDWCVLFRFFFSFNLICYGDLVLPFPFLLLRSALTEDYDVILFLLCTTLSVCHVLNTSIYYWLMALWLISLAEHSSSRGKLVLYGQLVYYRFM